MRTEDFFYTARDGFELYVKRYIPDGEIKGVVQFVHGMLEYSGRYTELPEFFVNQGFAFCAFDMRGHGETAQRSIEKGCGKFGVIAKKDGFFVAMEDIYEMVTLNKKQFPDKKIFVLSYSFGSFVTQRFMQEHGDSVDGCILCGTNGRKQFADICATWYTGFLSLFGRERNGRFLENFINNTYVARMKGKHKCNLDWMCTDKSVIEKYLADKWCYFGGTVGFYYDLQSASVHNHKAKNIRKVPKNLPMLFIWGDADPVAGYGKHVMWIIKVLQKNGCTDLSYKSYPRGGHEILREYCKDDVWNKILDWIETRI